ncbi:MAG: pyrimidine dimer DNA glycosylase/endonuclease V [Ignavibacteriae bacterium]|nr:pyrimidine dimer DNA glycosylase/endonuclease V [Ignavibacteriota bacterium]
MRIWSLHPKYLDTRGLVALWREALLARHVLEGKSRGYNNHPQLDRFKKAENPVDCINQYLVIVYQEAKERGYNFNKDKINWKFVPAKITVTTGQLKFEIIHLLNKLKTRDIQKYNKLRENKNFDVNPMFAVVDGDIENWEKIK